VLTQTQVFEAFALISRRLETVSSLVERRQAELALGQTFRGVSESVFGKTATLLPKIAPAGSG
jgi:hypothetical protein